MTAPMDRELDHAQAVSYYREPQAVTMEGAKRMPSVHVHLDLVDQLMDELERGMVDLLDARAGLEVRLGPILGAEGASLMARPDRPFPEQHCALDERLLRTERRMEALLTGMAAERDQLHDIARRVEV